MKRVVFATTLAIGLAASISTSPTAQARAHDYFDSLVARAEFFTGASFRPQPGKPPTSVHFQDQLLGKPGFATTSNPKFGYWVSYNPGSDTDPQKQDAAKVVIPAFSEISAGWAHLAADIGPSLTVLPLIDATTNLERGSTIKIDRELMIITARDLPAKNITVTRGQHGTSPASHAAGAALLRSTGSLQNQIRVPVATTDGHSYVFTWDSYWTRSYDGSGLTNHKAFQLTSAANQIWLETTTNFGDTVGSSCFAPGVLASIGMRSYNKVGGPASWLESTGDQLGPLVRRANPLEPRTAEFCIKSNTWTRFWIRVEQRINDYDYADMWVADESREAVKLFERLPVSVRTAGTTPNIINRFWLEYNTSSYAHTRGDQRDLVAYARNMVVLRDVADVRPILARPVPGAKAAVGPAPPTGVRIVSGS